MRAGAERIERPIRVMPIHITLDDLEVTNSESRPISMHVEPTPKA